MSETAPRVASPPRSASLPERSNSLADAFWRIAGAVSVRMKILGIVLALVLLLGVGTTVQVRVRAQQALVARLQEQSVAIGRDLAARATDLILINDLYTLHRLLEEAQQNNPDVSYAFVVDEEGRIVAHTFGEGFPAGLLEANTAPADEHHHTVALETDAGRIWDTAVPIFDGRAGTARVGLSEQSVNVTVETLTSQMLLTMVIVSAIGVGAAIVLTWLVTRPLLQLKMATQAVGRGDFSQRVRPWAADEIGDLALAFNEMTADLAQAEQERAEREQLRSQLLEKVIEAQEEERKRIARELHDETGQALTSLMVHLKRMNEDCPVPALEPQMEELRELIAGTLDGVHNLSLELRPKALDDLGLGAALQRYIHDWRNRYEIDIDFVVLGIDEQRLPPPVETALYRIVQEGLTNVARHARAQTVSVLLEHRDDHVRAIIEDDGVGFDPAQAINAERLGIYGMQERVELLGGTLIIESTPGQGTSVFAEVTVA
ncbi:MAG: HAMP domain-containing protein [Chloroflexota bacterium]